MSAESDYIRAERDNILCTMDMIEDLTSQEELTTYETIALGKLLQDFIRASNESSAAN